VPGGTFERSFGGGVADGGAAPATITGFQLDKYLVTVGRFRLFVAAWSGGWLPAAGSGKHAHLNGGAGLSNTGGLPAPPPPTTTYEAGWSSADDSSLAPTGTNLACDASYATWTVAPGPNERLPVNCVNWYEAYAFCIWDGGFLPSLWESTYATAGGAEQRSYPWGSTPPGTDDQRAIYGCFYPAAPDAATCTGVTNIAPVGTATLGAGKWGQLDLDGELFQWVLDTSGMANATSRCTNCVTEFGGLSHIATSTSFANPAADLALPQAAPASATARAFYLGFRCARSP
jgi:formylglycine-generating enzyme required for sulfatase activity